MQANDAVTKLNVTNGYWYFISLPYDVKVSDIGYEDGCQFVIRKYSGLNRAQQTGNTWQNLTIDSTMHAYEGYILRCSESNVSFTFPAAENNNKLFVKDNVTMPVNEYPSEFSHNASWNLIGNPYPCYYDTRRMEFTAPITVWEDSRYVAYSPIDDEYILSPTEAFFIQCPEDQEAITFNKEGRQTDAQAKEISDASKKVMAVKAQQRDVFNIYLSDTADTDRTRVVLNESASVAYELDKDAAKLFNEGNTSLLVYTLQSDDMYSINERPLSDSVVRLGMYINNEGTYTISLKTSSDIVATIIDREENKQTVLNNEGYTFQSKAGNIDNRFVIFFAPVKSGLDEISQNDNGVKINLEGNTLKVNDNYTVYSVDGKKIAQCTAGQSVNLTSGVYVVVSKSVNQKIVVK